MNSGISTGSKQHFMSAMFAICNKNDKIQMYTSRKSRGPLFDDDYLNPTEVS